MFKDKTIKLFLILSVIIFNFVGIVGCSNFEATKEQDPTKSPSVSETIESNNSNNDSGHMTGPSPINNLIFFNFASFNNYFNNLNMNNHSLVSFDLDNLSCVGTKKYFYGTNQPINNIIIDPKNYSHSIKYEFYSNDNPIGSGIDNTPYKIECYDVLLINNCFEYDFDFKLVKEQDTILIFDLMLNDECVMKIKIDMEENYTSKAVEDIVLLLENNIMIIKGGKNEEDIVICNCSVNKFYAFRKCKCCKCNECYENIC